MTREDVERQLLAIARQAHTDSIEATLRERRLLRDVLTRISSHGDVKSAELARATLRSWELTFTRSEVF